MLGRPNVYRLAAKSHFAGCGIGHLVSAHDECGAVLRSAREARSVSESGRCLHYAGAGVWTCDQWSYVHVVWLEGGVPSALVGGVVVAAAAAKLVRNVGERSNTTLDILSVALLAAGITAFVYSVGEFSTNLIAGIVALFAAIVLLGLFAARQLKLEHPVLNVRPMVSVRFWPACLLVVVSMMTTFSMSVLLPLYYEGAYGMTALVAGLLILPAIACNAVTSIVGGRVMDARGAWPLLPVGFALIAVGQTAISMTAASMNIGVVVALTVVVYAGVGLVLSPSQTAGLETLPAAEHPHGTALLNTWNMIAASFGPSLFIGLLSSSAAAAGAAGVATDVAQAIGFAAAVRVAAVIAVVGFAVSVVYARRESYMSH